MKPKRFLAWGIAACAVILSSSALSQPQAVPGFTTAPLATVAAPTSLAFGPGDADGPDLYATTLVGGNVTRVHLQWTGAGPLATGTSTVASGFSQPLGLAFDGDGVLYVSDSHPNPDTGRTDGRVTRVVNAQKTVIVDGLPNGRHNTNHLRFGPDGRLYITNGNPNDSGCPESGCVGGDPDVFPYSGAVLSVDTAEVASDPAVLKWVDKNGELIPPDEVSHPRHNHDFARKVDVLAHGFRNIFGVAFAPADKPYAGTAYTAMNGADDPASQDTLHRITPDTFYGFPFCYNVGSTGGTGEQVSVENNPLFPDADCSDIEPATALMGWHVCTTGLDFPSAAGPAAFPETFRDSVYVAECTAFFAGDLIQRLLDEPSTDNTSHKVVRVRLDDNGEAVALEDFVVGLVLSTDVLFGPDGAMYIADVEQIYRVAPL